MGSDFLFARPSRLSGVARTLDLFGLFDEYNVSQSPEEADTMAFWVDFGAVGGDLSSAMQTFVSMNSADDAEPDPRQFSLVFAPDEEKIRLGR